MRYAVVGSLSILFVSAFCNQSMGQDPSPATTLGSVTIASPNAASLGKFGDIPVSYHTGVPAINIPIYTVEAGPLKLPISLDYHASGLKVMEPASWVGAGWALNAGGVITRTVNGQPDEAGANSGGQLYGHFSQYGYNNYFYTSTFGGMQQDWMDFANGQRDGEPDLFFFNFGGYTGKFYFRDDKTPVIVPEQDLQIIPSYSGGRSIDYFTVVTPDGTRYTFGNSPNVTSGVAPIEITNTFTPKNGASVAPPTSSWYLNQVASADNQFNINLTYQAESYGYYTIAMFPVDAAESNGPDGSTGFCLAKDLINGVRLSQISFPNGTVSFTPGALRTDLCDNLSVLTESPNSSATSLGGIQISDNNGFCKNYKFSYSYFQGNNASLPTSFTLGNTFSTDENRLRLDNIQESSCDNSLNVPPYKFTYYGGTLPRRLSFGIDHWGYYNGADGNTSLIPTIVVNGNTIAGATRDAAWPAMEFGMLTRIDYPTGGYNTFDFESNSAVVATQVQDINTLIGQVMGYFEHEQQPLSATVACTSNGNNPVTLQIQTDCNFGGNLTIYDAQGNQFFSTAYNARNDGGPIGDENSQPQVITIPYTAIGGFLPAGNYTIKVTLGGNPPAGGVYIGLTQPKTDIVYKTVLVGGLRIKTITSSDGLTSNNQVTNYSYNDQSGNSTAVQYGVPTYAMSIRNDIIANTGYWTVNGFQTNSLIANGCPAGGGDYLKSPGSIRPMATVQGSIIGYQRVTVSQPGNGSSAYTYYTANNNYSSLQNGVLINNTVSTTCDASIPNYPPAPLPFDSKRGELSSEQHYDNNGNMLKDVYYYPTFNESPILSTPAFIAKARSFAGTISYLGTIYSLNTVKKVSLMTIEHDYNMGATSGNITKTNTTYFWSNFHNQPTRVVTTTSTGDSLATNMTYAADLRLAGCDAISDCSAEYNTACQSCQNTYNAAQQSCVLNNPSDANAQDQCITTAYLNFMQCNTNARIAYVSCRNTNYMNAGTGSLFGQCHLNAENMADNTLKPVLMLQDEYQNPVVETSQWRDNNLKKAVFVQYTPSTTPSGFIYPGKEQIVNMQAPSASFSPAAISGNTVARDSRYLDESNYTFINGNVQQVTAHDGISNLYLWAYGNTRPIAKVANAALGQIAYTSFEVDEAGGWSYSGAAAADPAAFTGSNSYSLSQPNGTITASGLTSSSRYIVSYWSKTGSAYTVSGSTSVTQGKTVSVSGTHWTYFEHVVSGVTSVSVTGGGVIDELRLYPQNAQMTTYTYSPLLGLTSQCDVGNRAIYYHYDALGRLQYVQDQDGNVVKTYQYHYKGQ